MSDQRITVSVSGFVGFAMVLWTILGFAALNRCDKYVRHACPVAADGGAR